ATCESRIPPSTPTWERITHSSRNSVPTMRICPSRSARKLVRKLAWERIRAPYSVATMRAVETGRSDLSPSREARPREARAGRGDSATLHLHAPHPGPQHRPGGEAEQGHPPQLDREQRQRLARCETARERVDRCLDHRGERSGPGDDE